MQPPPKEGHDRQVENHSPNSSQTHSNSHTLSQIYVLFFFNNLLIIWAAHIFMGVEPSTGV